MKPRHWMQIAAVASAVGLAGSAIANDDVAGANASATNAGATSEGAARVIDQATPQPAYGARIDSALQSSDVNPNASSSAPGDVDTNAAAASSLDGNASTANDLNHQNAVNANDRAQDNAANASEADRNGAANANEGSVSGTTQGSTMQSPKSTSGSASGLPGNANGGDRLSTTNSNNFDAWASDYASQHDGRITRQEFLNEMGQRFDRLDAQHQGSLTPYEVEEIFIYTPANPSAAQSSGANESTNRLPASNGSSPSTTSSGNVQ